MKRRRESRLLPPFTAGLAFALAFALGAAPSRAAAQDPASAKGYSLAADAAVGFALALPSLDSSLAASSAAWSLSANLLHRLEGRGWLAVLNQTLYLPEAAAAAPSPALPLHQVAHEAYLSLELGEAASLAIGKRRMQLGLGTVFAPGDLVNPRSGFWDQKEGFRGLSFAGSLGSELSLRAALSAEDNLEAPSGGSADPALLVWAASAELQAGRLQLALGGAFSPDRVARPSLGLSAELSGLILQAEGALELAEGAEPSGTAGARYALYGDSLELDLSLDAAFGRLRGLENRLYLLPSARVGLANLGSAFCRALLGLEDGSALLSAGLTASFLEDCELELGLNLGLGPEGGELAALPPPLGAMRGSAGLAARIHF